MSVIADPQLKVLLDGLHGRSGDQVTTLEGFDRDRATESELKTFLSDKLVALDRDKAELCYQLCRATNARRIVEIGTSFGVSTLYLAAAVQGQYPRLRRQRRGDRHRI